MITPFPPPAARVELLRVRRIGSAIPADFSAKRCDLDEQPSVDALHDHDCVEQSDVARALAKAKQSGSCDPDNNPTRN